MSFSNTTTGDEVVKHFAAQAEGKTCRCTFSLPSSNSKANDRSTVAPPFISCFHIVLDVNMSDRVYSMHI